MLCLELVLILALRGSVVWAFLKQTGLVHFVSRIILSLGVIFTYRNDFVNFFLAISLVLSPLDRKSCCKKFS